MDKQIMKAQQKYPDVEKVVKEFEEVKQEYISSIKICEDEAL